MPVHDQCLPAGDDSSVASSVLLAALAAAGFGAFFVVLDLATTPATANKLGPSLAVALAVQVGALMVTILAASRHTRACLTPRRPLLLAAATIGVVDVLADLMLVIAVGLGPLAVVGPLGSLDPVVSVLIATTVLRERLRVLQVLGIVVVLAGITLVAVG